LAKPNWDRLSRDAATLLSCGQVEEAIKLFRSIAQAYAEVPDVHNNLAVALKSVGLIEEAMTEYEVALTLDSTFVAARLNLARALRQLAQHDKALQILLQTSDAGATLNDIYSEMELNLFAMAFPLPSKCAHAALTLLFNNPSRDLRPLFAPAARLLFSDPSFSGIMKIAENAYPNRESCAFLAPLEIASPLLNAILLWTIVAIPDVEKWITLVRVQLLERLAAGVHIETDQSLLWSIAAQCHATQHASAATPGELKKVDAVIAEMDQFNGTAVAIAAMFRPLQTIPVAVAVWDTKDIACDNQSFGSPMSILMRRGIGDRQVERRLQAGIKTLTPIQDPTSSAVRGQYEEYPYPVWLSFVPPAAPTSFSHWARQRFPSILTDTLDLDHSRILVAGCGTGRQAIHTAIRRPGSSVLAVDVSRASLSFAIRRAEELRVPNIEFSQADILEMGGLDERFDLIECSGVLHHMADPLAGWRVLIGLLKPKALMRIGLYSEMARKSFKTLRNSILSAAAPEQIANQIRAHRRDILTRPLSASESAVIRIEDFYSLSGCHDLLFHTHELGFSLPALADMLARLNRAYPLNAHTHNM